MMRGSGSNLNEMVMNEEGLSHEIHFPHSPNLAGLSPCQIRTLHRKSEMLSCLRMNVVY